MSRVYLHSSNQTLCASTNGTELKSIIDNETTSEKWTEDSFPGLEILCTIYVTYAVIISVGLLGNAILIKVFFQIKSMQTVPNIFITSLAFGDLLLLLTCVPVDATRYIVDTWIFGRIGCKLLSFIQLTSVGVSVFTLTVLSADRWVWCNWFASVKLEMNKRAEMIILHNSKWHILMDWKKRKNPPIYFKNVLEKLEQFFLIDWSEKDSLSLLTFY